VRPHNVADVGGERTLAALRKFIGEDDVLGGQRRTVVEDESGPQRDLHRGAACRCERRSLRQQWLRKERRVGPVEPCVDQAANKRR
jgi:hypothetical protein